jgi:hypothetical protein
LTYTDFLFNIIRITASGGGGVNSVTWVRQLFLAKLLMTNSMVISVRIFVKAVMRRRTSSCPAQGVMTNFMVTLAMTYFVVE